MLRVRLSSSLLAEVALHCAALLVHVVCAALRSAPSSAVAAAVPLDAAGTRALALDLAPLVLLSSFCVCAAIGAHSEEAVGGRGQGPAEWRWGARLLSAAPTSPLRRWGCSLPVRAAVAAAMAAYTGGQGIRAEGGGAAGEWSGVGSSAALLTISLAVGLAAFWS